MAIYFGSREVKVATPTMGVDTEGKEISLGEVLVEYAEGTPQFEAVPTDEWEAGKSEEPVKAGDKAKWFVDRTTKMRTEIHKIFEKSNPRFNEIGKVLQWIQEGYRQAFVKAIELKTGMIDIVNEGTFDLIVKTHEEAKTKEYADLSQLSKDILEVLRKHEVKLGEVLQGGMFQQLQSALESLTNSGFSLILGSDDEHRRTNDLVDIFDFYGKKLGEEDGAVDKAVEDTGSEGKDTGTLEDTSGSSVESSSN